MTLWCYYLVVTKWWTRRSEKEGIRNLTLLQAHKSTANVGKGTSTPPLDNRANGNWGRWRWNRHDSLNERKEIHGKRFWLKGTSSYYIVSLWVEAQHFSTWLDTNLADFKINDGVQHLHGGMINKKDWPLLWRVLYNVIVSSLVYVFVIASLQCY